MSLTTSHDLPWVLIIDEHPSERKSSEYSVSQPTWEHQRSSESNAISHRQLSPARLLQRTPTVAALTRAFLDALEIAIEDGYVSDEEASSAGMTSTIRRASTELHKLMRVHSFQGLTLLPTPILSVIDPSAVDIEFRTSQRAVLIRVDYDSEHVVTCAGLSHDGEERVGGHTTSLSRLDLYLKWLLGSE